MNDDENQPLGDPQPIKPAEGRKILKRVAGYVVVAAGGFIAFATLLAPARVSGASRSARLQWQQRQKEIQETIKQERGGSESHPSAGSNSGASARR
jgi:hypothetical protein